jgi:hypothetical protein
LGDEVDQAAWWAGISMTSMPFCNLMPWTTFSNWFSPFNRRHVFAAALTSHGWKDWTVATRLMHRVP